MPLFQMRVGSEWVCFNITDIRYHIQRNQGGGSDFFAFAHAVERPDRCAFVCVCLCEGKAD